MKIKFFYMTSAAIFLSTFQIMLSKDYLTIVFIFTVMITGALPYRRNIVGRDRLRSWNIRSEMAFRTQLKTQNESERCPF